MTSVTDAPSSSVTVTRTDLVLPSVGTRTRRPGDHSVVRTRPSGSRASTESVTRSPAETGLGSTISTSGRSLSTGATNTSSLPAATRPFASATVTLVVYVPCDSNASVCRRPVSPSSHS